MAGQQIAAAGLPGRRGGVRWGLGTAAAFCCSGVIGRRARWRTPGLTHAEAESVFQAPVRVTPVRRPVGRAPVPAPPRTRAVFRECPGPDLGADVIPAQIVGLDPVHLPWLPPRWQASAMARSATVVTSHSSITACCRTRR